MTAINPGPPSTGFNRVVLIHVSIHCTLARHTKSINAFILFHQPRRRHEPAVVLGPYRRAHTWGSATLLSEASAAASGFVRGACSRHQCSVGRTCDFVRVSVGTVDCASHVGVNVSVYACMYADVCVVLCVCVCVWAEGSTIMVESVSWHGHTHQ